MSAFVYALNDSDERVRTKAADEIGDQIRRNRCQCGPSVIRALQCALADCDRGVRRQAEEALQLSGYKIVNGRCSGSTNCCSNAWRNYPQAPADPAAAGAPSISTEDHPAPTPVPGEAGVPQAIPPSSDEPMPMNPSDMYDADPKAEPAPSAPLEDGPPPPTSEGQTYFRARLHKLIRGVKENRLTNLLGQAY